MDATPRGKAHPNNICSLRDDNWTQTLQEPWRALHIIPRQRRRDPYTNSRLMYHVEQKKGLLSFDVDVY